MEPSPCANHPGTTTRLACSSCERPICPRCVRSTSVGQRCPQCAKPPKGAQVRGKPEHYARAVGAGLGVALVGGLAVGQVGFGSIILGAVVGFAVGRVVAWGAKGQTQEPFPQMAVVIAVIGIFAGFMVAHGQPVPPGGISALAYLAAGWLAWRGVHS